jgi:hypothetical protein
VNPCGEYVFDLRNASMRDWFIKVPLHVPAPHKHPACCAGTLQPLERPPP